MATSLRLDENHVAVRNGWLREHGLRVEGYRMPSSVKALIVGVSEVPTDAAEVERACRWAESVWPPESWEAGIPLLTS